jgi:hypothetical protein
MIGTSQSVHDHHISSEKASTYHDITRPPVQRHAQILDIPILAKEILQVFFGRFFVEASDDDDPAFDRYLSVRLPCDDWHAGCYQVMVSIVLTAGLAVDLAPRLGLRTTAPVWVLSFRQDSPKLPIQPYSPALEQLSPTRQRTSVKLERTFSSP